MQISHVSSPPPLHRTHTPEYVIYAYDQFHDEKLGQNHWQRVLSSEDIQQTLFEAERLFMSEKYQKIEIQKKTLDKKTGKFKASVYKVMDHNKPRNNLLTLTLVLLLPILSVGAFYLNHMN